MPPLQDVFNANRKILLAKNLYEQGLTIEQIARAIGFGMDTVEK